MVARSSITLLLCSSLILADAFSSPALHGTRRACVQRAAPASMGLFDFFGTDEAKEAERERQFEEQQAILARRRDPTRNAKYLQDIEARRRRESATFRDGIAWQQDKSKDPLAEFKRRQAASKVKPLGYEDVPKGGIQLPMASFGVGGEFGLGGKYDNGQRFDLRLPYVDQGWVEDGADKVEQVPFWENLMSGGRLQREASERARKQRDPKNKKK